MDSLQAHLPNVRKLFTPDPGYVLYDADLSGADAQVVAWEANDTDLKTAFREGINIHVKNAEDILGEAWHEASGGAKVPGTEKARLYKSTKAAVHATNYGARPRTVAASQGWTIARAERFQSIWFHLHPGIARWHDSVRSSLYRSSSVSNQFGYRRIYYDRIDSIVPEALAWGPQSTVAEVCFRGTLRLLDRCPWVEPLLQVHDSIVFQIPIHRDDCEEQMIDALSVEVPYSDPLVIPWKLAKSRTSWGDCQ